MLATLQKLVSGCSDYVELRYHKRIGNTLAVRKGRVDTANHATRAGIGIRVLRNHSWGFAACSDLDEGAIRRGIDQARANADLIATQEKSTIILADASLSQDDYVGPGYQEISSMSLGEKLEFIVAQERLLSGSSSAIQSAKCQYAEIIEEKCIATSDGALCQLKLVQPELSLVGVAEKKGEMVSSHTSAGVNGGWQCLFSHPSLENMVDRTAKITCDLLSARYPEGGRKDVILSPSLVGLLCHEAIGHTVEADFVKAGSIAKGKIGEKIASELVHLNDTGCEQIGGYAVGNQPFDDEGVKTETTQIIEKGILRSYLHNRETAGEFGVKPTGNARAWLYHDEPLIRMRNTYMLPGEDKLSDMIANLEDGFLIDGSAGGQADSNGEFMFGCSHLWRVKNGKKVELHRKATLSGIAFDVLQSVTQVSREFQWDLGSGYCGKGQPAKVDAGGPYVRCQMMIGGRQ